MLLAVDHELIARIHRTEVTRHRIVSDVGTIFSEHGMPVVKVMERIVLHREPDVRVRFGRGLDEFITNKVRLFTSASEFVRIWR